MRKKFMEEVLILTCIENIVLGEFMINSNVGCAIDGTSNIWVSIKSPCNAHQLTVTSCLSADLIKKISPSTAAVLWIIVVDKYI